MKTNTNIPTRTTYYVSHFEDDQHWVVGEFIDLESAVKQFNIEKNNKPKTNWYIVERTVTSRVLNQVVDFNQLVPGVEF